ncbi:MAG: polyprenyl synthetase family protein [Ktedonobacteraceae bacterium]
MSNDTQPPVNLFAAQQEVLRERLIFLLATQHPVLRADVVRALEEEGKLLAKPRADAVAVRPAGSWALLTMLVAQHIDPDIDLFCVSSVAIAVECFVCALDLLDDVEDEDQTPSIRVLGVARALNVATALMMLAQQAISSLSQQAVPPGRILSLLDTLQASALNAAAGQHRDLLAEQRSAQELTLEECIEIAASKAGALMRLACRLGALCARADDVMCEHFSELGELLGIAHQLDNDAHDLYYLLQSETSAVPPTKAENITRSIKTDLVRQKKTMPVVLAARVNSSLQKASAPVDKEEHLRALHEGIIATWGICLLYRERAGDRLRMIEDQRSLAPALRFLLDL